ncbi:MAG: elongation factor Ts [Clostridia bacterium]|nr:elongation factor Ts [Clostridia bacterium]
MAFTAKDVMALREKTGAGMMDCKKALTDADGDMEKAMELLRERGIAKAEKKASRIAAEGVVLGYVEGKTGVLVEVNCESDFVANGPKFKDIVTNVAKQIAAKQPATVEELLAQEYIGEAGKTVETYIKEQVAVIGEKISVRRFVIKNSDGYLTTYIHLGGKLGVLLDVAASEVTDAVKEVAHDITLQIAFTKPSYLTESEVSEETLEKEKSILKETAINAGKKPEIAEKMVAGGIKKFYQENVLLDQAFIKDDKKTVAQLVKGAGSDMAINSFAFYVMGEGLEKKQEDLSAEVAKQVEAMKK